MNRMASALVVAVALLLVPAVALADRASAAQGDKGKTASAIGAVTAVTTDSLTVKAGGGEMTFAIDKETSVTAKGATRKSLELKADGKSGRLTDFVKVGDAVTVSYKDGTTKLATSIRVTTPAK